MRMRSILVATALTATAVLGGASTAVADPDPGAVVTNSPGLISGSAIQIPVDLGLNLCGNTIDVLGLLNRATGNKCKTN